MSLDACLEASLRQLDVGAREGHELPLGDREPRVSCHAGEPGLCDRDCDDAGKCTADYVEGAVIAACGHDDLERRIAYLCGH